ncbi:ribosome biogenesis protein [Candidatus Woesearchaeota archaeon]|nr:ribosome biogenesis protein [Candidatus Woesearchaeota archaeon]
MRQIFKCNNCNKYTMKDTCDCGNKTRVPKPLKYSPNDGLGSYRRKAKLHEYAERGLI